MLLQAELYDYEARAHQLCMSMSHERRKRERVLFALTVAVRNLKCASSHENDEEDSGRVY